jgi:hypothetical protein
MSRSGRNCPLTALCVVLDGHGLETKHILMREQFQQLDFSESRDRELESKLATPDVLSRQISM